MATSNIQRINMATSNVQWINMDTSKVQWIYMATSNVQRINMATSNVQWINMDTSNLPLQWRHNGPDSVSNHQPHHCLLNRLFRRRSKKTSKLRVTGLCAGNSPETGQFPAQMASYAENVSIWWRHHTKMSWGRHEASTINCRMITCVMFCQSFGTVAQSSAAIQGIGFILLMHPDITNHKFSRILISGFLADHRGLDTLVRTSALILAGWGVAPPRIKTYPYLLWSGYQYVAEHGPDNFINIFLWN